MIHVDLSSFTLAKWNEGRICTALSPLAARERRCFMPSEFWSSNASYMPR